MSVTPIFSRVSGLNTALHPLRIPYDPENGITALAAAVNVVVDDSGMALRRDGYTEVDDQPWHSLFHYKSWCVGVRGDTLHLIADDLSIAPLRSGLEHRVSYAQVNEDIYYTSLSGYGIVRGGAHVDWTAQPYVGPDTNRTFSGPFPAEHIAFWDGRIWLARDGYIICSEPFGWSWFDPHGRLMPMDSRVRMLLPAQGGMFVSTEYRVYFLSGSGPESYNLKIADDIPALEYSQATGMIDGMELGMEFPGHVVFWLSDRGPVLGSSEGWTIQLAREKMVYPQTAPVGASLLRGYHLVHTMGV